MRKLLIFVLAVVLISITSINVSSNFTDAQIRSKIARVKRDMRDIEKGLEAYFLDHNAYPGEVPLVDFARHTPKKKGVSNPWWDTIEKLGGAGLKTVDPGLSVSGISGLTTPVPYLEKHPLDEFANIGSEKNLPYAYYLTSPNVNPGWLLFSPGPDQDYDLLEPDRLYNSEEKYISLELSRLAYSHYHGLRSNGDIWRIKEDHFDQFAPWRW